MNHYDDWTFEGENIEEGAKYFRSPDGERINRMGVDGVMRFWCSVAAWDSIGRHIALGEQKHRVWLSMTTGRLFYLWSVDPNVGGKTPRFIGSDDALYDLFPKDMAPGDVRGPFLVTLTEEKT